MSTIIFKLKWLYYELGAIVQGVGGAYDEKNNICVSLHLHCH